MKWTPKRARRAHQAKTRLRVERAGVGMEEPEWCRVARGEYLGTLQWHAADGQVRRWVIRQGDRANNITVRALVLGKDRGVLQRTWTWLTDGLRRVMAMPRRMIRRAD